MKNLRIILPAILFAGIFIYSCANGERSGYGNAEAKMDSSASVAFAPPDAQKESSKGYLRDEKTAAPGTQTETFFKDQTEILNNEYNEFVYMMRSTAARPTKLDSTHRFIRTADIRFRVKNVAYVSYNIEELATKFGGYVADTKLVSQLQSNFEKPVSADSALQTMRYVVTNAIVLRVPVENLDTTLKSLVKYIDYLDYRNVNTNDITLELLANKLAAARIAKFNQRLAFSVDNKSSKLTDVQGAEESMLNQQANSDNALIENLRKNDLVKYSTITLNIYQPVTIRQELISREKNIDEYEPGLGTKLIESLSSGWHGLQVIIIGIVTLWPLWLFGAATWILILRILKRTKKNDIENKTRRRED
ncbi:MAG: DUF4349 domain-containing protein [Bacteroidia bacterium]